MAAAAAEGANAYMLRAGVDAAAAAAAAKSWLTTTKLLLRDVEDADADPEEADGDETGGSLVVEVEADTEEPWVASKGFAFGFILEFSIIPGSRMAEPGPTGVVPTPASTSGNCWGTS